VGFRFFTNFGYSLLFPPKRRGTLVTATRLGSIEADLRLYLRENYAPVSPEFTAVVGDVIRFTSAVVEKGFRRALAELGNSVDGLADRGFIEVADVIVEHHLRLEHGPDRELVRKSALEAYLHACGPQYAFEPPAKTEFLRSLRRWNSRDFAAQL